MRSVELAVAKIAKLWKVGAVRIEIFPDSGACVVTGRCVCNGWPLKGWVVGEYMLIARGDSLGEALHEARKGPKTEKVEEKTT